MSKNEKGKTKSVNATVRAGTSARTIVLDKIACQVLATKVIQQAREDNDTSFFNSVWYDFWSCLAYGMKSDCISAGEIIYMIEHGIDRRNNKNTRGRTPRCI